MKKNILKSLAVSVLAVVALAGCTTNADSSSVDVTSTSTETGPTVTTISDVLVWDSDNNQPDAIGAYVTFQNVTVIGNLEESVYVMQVDSAIYSIQVFIEGYDNSYTVGNEINVTGTIGTVEGRIVLLDAVAELVDEGDFSFYYYATYRSYFDSLVSRTLSGTVLGVTLQLAEDVGILTYGESKTFYVTFPGEDTDTDNVYNYFLMPVYVPATLTRTEVLTFNQYFASLQAGDAISGYFNYHYINGESGFLFSDIALAYAGETSVSVFTDDDRGTAIMSAVESYVIGDEAAFMPESIAVDTIYSYYLDDYYYEDYGQFSIMAYTYNTSLITGSTTSTAFSELVSYFQNIDGLEEYTNDGTYAEYYPVEGSAGDIAIGIEETMCYIEIVIITGNPSIIAGGSFDSLFSNYESAVNSYIASGRLTIDGYTGDSDWQTALPDFENEITVDDNAYPYGLTYLDRTDETTYLGYENGGVSYSSLLETFTIWYYTDDTTSDATLTTLRSAFYELADVLDEAEGWEQGYTGVYYSTTTGAYYTAYGNSTTNEVVMTDVVSGRYGTGIMALMIEVWVVDEAAWDNIFFTSY